MKKGPEVFYSLHAQEIEKGMQQDEEMKQMVN